MEQNRFKERIGHQRDSLRVRRSLRANDHRNLFKCIVLLTLGLALSNDLTSYLNRAKLSTRRTSGSVWASWIGEIPSAAELYGDAAQEAPTTESFNDDDDDEDEELDASATNEYPDNENDEAYDDNEDNDNAESGRRERWLRPGRRHSVLRRSIMGQEGRQVPVVMVVERARLRRWAGKVEDDFGVDEDGDEDAWVHDGVDDIHIDPETKQAASDHSYDETPIDAEYEPKTNVVNRTRITTISEVIPMVQSDDPAGQQQSSLKRAQYANPPEVATSGAERPQELRLIGPMDYAPPASHLSFAQLEHLLAGVES